MSTAHSYHDALLTLSGNPALAATRNALLASISDSELIDVIAHGLKTGARRAHLNTLATQRLDELSVAREEPTAVAHVEGEGGGDADGLHDETRNNDQSQSSSVRPVIVQGECELLGNIRTTADIETEARPTPAAQQKPVINPARNSGSSSLAKGKRKNEATGQAQNKRRYIPPLSDTDEEDLSVEELSVGESEEDIASTEDGKPDSIVELSEDEEEFPEALVDKHDSSFFKAKISEMLISWEKVQSRSLLTDLVIIDSDDAKDKAHAGLIAQIPWPHYGRDPMPSVSVRLEVTSTSYGFVNQPIYSQQPLSEYHAPFTKEVVRKFNSDYLKNGNDRLSYRTFIESKRGGGDGACIRLLLEEPCRPVEPKYSACETCVRKRLLCARREYYKYGKWDLVIWPLPEAYRKDISPNSMRYWVLDSDKLAMLEDPLKLRLTNT